MPKRASVLLSYTRQLNVQSDVGAFVQSNGLKALGAAVDKACLTRSGIFGEPLGFAEYARDIASHFLDQRNLGEHALLCCELRSGDCSNERHQFHWRGERKTEDDVDSEISRAAGPRSGTRTRRLQGGPHA